jgi:carbonic anhydrase
VIGIFFDRQAGGDYPNPLLTSLQFNQTQNGVTTNVTNVNLASFLGGLDFSRYWSYAGSLTTPPCSEGIKWTVLEQVQPISKEQLTSFTQFFAGDIKFALGKGNNRAI